LVELSVLLIGNAGSSRCKTDPPAFAKPSEEATGGGCRRLLSYLKQQQMTEKHKKLIIDRVLDEATFVKMTINEIFDSKQLRKIDVRPVLVKGKKKIQISYLDKVKDVSKNYIFHEAVPELRKLLDLSFRSIDLKSCDKKLRVLFSPCHRPIFRWSKADQTQIRRRLHHDRIKKLPLASNEPNSFLEQLGIMSSNGRIYSNKQDKFSQINCFLQLLLQIPELRHPKQLPLQILDCGCGSALLTFASYYYLSKILGMPLHIVGIDLKSNLIQKRRDLAKQLGYDGMHFYAQSIHDFDPQSSPDIVFSLHACDTATDEAIAKGIIHDAQIILSAPCCHKHLNQQLRSDIFKSISRHGILHQRLGDVLTDAFRAQILRIMGYKTAVIEFVSSEHTTKNLLIRAVKRRKSGDSRFVSEYLAMKEFWKVRPYLEKLLPIKIAA
jgi:SAM-dependent methyltransferase